MSNEANDLARRVADLEDTVRSLKAEVTRLSGELERMGEEARRLSSDMLPFRRVGPPPVDMLKHGRETFQRLSAELREQAGGSS